MSSSPFPSCVLLRETIFYSKGTGGSFNLLHQHGKCYEKYYFFSFSFSKKGCENCDFELGWECLEGKIF